MAQSDYGRAGLLAMLTPQANTTVEPELWSLMPPDWSMINARLTSDKGTIEERLVDYTEKFVDVSDEFANAPITVLAAGCTGASYLIGRAREAELMAALSDRRGVPAITAAYATVEALRALDARTIALVSPYPGALDAACTPYWEGFGFEVVAKTGPDLQTAKFHPIYAMQGAATRDAMVELQGSGADAIVMLGTGMATLEPIIHARGWDGPVPLSCNLAMIWAAVELSAGRPLSRETLLPWIDAGGWMDRYHALFPPTRGHAA